MRKMNMIVFVVTLVGMMAGAISGNTNTLLANGFLMLTITMVSLKD